MTAPHPTAPPPAPARTGAAPRPAVTSTPPPADGRPVPPETERAWEARWAALQDDPAVRLFRPRADGDRPRRYLLTMFPYPSGDLHMGHAEVFAIEDVVARYWRARGHDVLNPVGWDSFGLPAENAAIRRDENPATFTDANIATQAASIRRYGVSFDWSRRLQTSDPGYYRWTQWLFLRLLEHGLAYRAAAPVNWCPQDATVLANEQVVGGRCERCGAQVVRRELTQWFVRTTAYADRLLDDMADLADAWPERVLTMQRNWIGRSRGARVRFPVVGGDTAIEVFTTRPDTLAAVTFVVVAPDGPLAESLCEPAVRDAFEAYRAAARAEPEVTRWAAGRAPSGVDLGVHVRHPTTGAELPVWAADYVLPGYGTGAVMGVPAHDDRDRAFADVYGLPVLDVPPADPDVTLAALEEGGTGERATSYRLRDWLVSRQRYWGAPVPVVHCPACGVVPVPDAALPVRLPDLRGDALLPRGTSPLAGARDWVTTSCPRCGGTAERDTDTLDTFVDSSWYFLRYLSPGRDDVAFDPADARAWMPVARYVGGVEHAILHLLYSRFVTKFLHDLGLVVPVEPFASLLNQGQVVNGGKAMSKSLGNGVALGEQLDRYGVDAVRLALLFSGPPEDDVDWADVRPEAMQRFLRRALLLSDDVARLERPARSAPGEGGAPVAGDDGGDPALPRTLHVLVGEIADLVEADRFNVAVARLMTLVSAVRSAAAAVGPDDAPSRGVARDVREAAEAVAVILSLFAPYSAEELWRRLGHGPSVALAPWPEVAAPAARAGTVVAVVQVDGKVRDRLDVDASIGEDALRALALASDAVQRRVDGTTVRRVVVRAPHLVNVVLAR
ncbi:leucine--tRNA ligase [Luteimicrobium sp. NPDC057192]|uniref:leucine--tRNA ligase n=1 Tax=Luteimicrobium sp. NPDC057192 TaxID=3346042 RepID=UPI00362B78CD